MVKAENASRKPNWLAIKRHQEKQDHDWNSYADAVLDDTNQFDGKPHVYLTDSNPTVKPQRLTPRELKAIRYLDMGARVKKASEATA